jgi:GDP-4-dehydro-6-deoxy-D-mannose reductase
VLTSKGEGLDSLQLKFPSARVQKLDICEAAAVQETMQRERPDVVMHLAAVTFVPQAERERKLAFDTTVGGTLNILNAAAGLSNVRVLFVSSAHIYAAAPGPVDESTPVVPNGFYGVTKRMAEDLALYYSAKDCFVAIARPFNHTGPGQRTDFAIPSFARQIAEAERGIREPKIRVGNLDAVRDFLDVRDVVRAYRAIATQGQSGEIYNICSGRGRSIWSVLQGLIARARVPVEVETDPSRLRGVDTPAIVGDSSKLQRATDWRPSIPFEQTLDDLLAEARRI